MLAHHIVWTFGFLVVFSVYWEIYGEHGRRVPNAIDPRLTVKSFRPCFPIVFYSSALICVTSAWGLDIFSVRTFDTPLARDAGLSLAFVGCGLARWAKRTLGDSYSPCYASVLPARLIATGPYGWVRHPLYSANLFALFGLALATTSAVLFVAFAVVAAFYFRAAGREERTLTIELPGYRAYRARTGRFIPCPLQSRDAS